MTRLRIAIATVPLVIGLSVLVVELARGHWLSGLTCLLLGCVVCWGCILGFADSRDSMFLRIATPIAMLLGLCAVFAEDRAFDVSVATAHIDAFQGFTRLQQYCKPFNEELQRLQSEGIRACAMQDKFDQISAVADLQKAKSLPPPLALADGAKSALSVAQADACLDARDSAKTLCPEAFYAVDAPQRSAH